jgi:nucleotide-binding universal stress UspA family protein
MYKHILIATDGSELANRGVVHGVELAKAVGAAVTVVAVTEMWSAYGMLHEYQHDNQNPIVQYEELASQAAQRVLAGAQRLAESHGVKAATKHVADRPPAEGIIATAVDLGCDLIVMASHGRRGMGRLILGSQAYEVLTHSKIPTLIVR